MDNRHDDKQTYIRLASLRRRWDNMPMTTFQRKRKEGIIPAPVYPFGPDTPYWLLAEIESMEAEARERKNVPEVVRKAAT